ncbi:efflux RND transporter periplasmic adaptor subunit [Amaricoccus sp.]|uniref:efflux RND transporter periplasmic adaptor subunit n=1 Tax=Amaricoccus sp. TaxID=1872485 RepID=UPI001B6B5137|nr:efflux RND transporter periplasmic adaptor subunit [Amaricoccus sp.]MBP7001894.1 efflux RND transporter periplasmic adaptor subunit [Amaricoccus sp.]
MAGHLRDAADKAPLHPVRAEAGAPAQPRAVEAPAAAQPRVVEPAAQPRVVEPAAQPRVVESPAAQPRVAEPPAGPGKRRGRGRWVVGALAAAAAVAAGLWLRPAAETASAPITAPVALGTVEESVLATGLLKPTDLVAVGAQVSGRIVNLAVSLGQEVRAGDLIAEIDPAPRENAIRIAEAALAEVRAERTEQEATLAEQRRVLARREALAARAAISEADAETAASEVEVTQARIDALDARIRSAEVAVEDARIDLGYARITAPGDGTVLAVVAQQGQTVNATQTTPTIVVLGRLDVMSVEAEISEADVVRVAPGQAAWFTIVGDPETRYPATLASIAPAPTSITKDTLLTGEASTANEEAIYYNGILTVPNPDGRLRTYMTAQVHLVLGRAEDVPTIPAAALGARNADGTRAATVVGAEGALETRTVTTGLADDALVEVRSGLAVGENVAIGDVGAAPARSTAARRGPPPMGF